MQDGPALTDAEIREQASISYTYIGSAPRNIPMPNVRAVADAQLRKALWWVWGLLEKETASKNEITRGIYVRARHDLEDVLIASGIDPWPSAPDNAVPETGSSTP